MVMKLSILCCTQNDKDDIDNIIEEVNAISSDAHVQATVEKPTSEFTYIHS